MFKFDENDRTKKEVKKDFKKIDKEHKGKIKFKHLIGKSKYTLIWIIDYYLGSSD